MRVFIKCTDWPATATLQDRLFPELIQSVALTELMLQKWFEPPELGQGDFSTLVQQILSILAQTGGARAIELFQRLVQEGAFRYLDQPTFGSVLRSLAEHDLIEQMPEGDLILGLKGQQIVSHYDFYSAFMTAIEYRVLYQSRLIGMLSPENISQTGDAILLGGRSWRIADVDHPRREVYVVPAAASKAPLFPPSERLVHQRVREEMRQILGAEQSFAYLSDQGTELLTRARDAARNSDALTRKILQLDKTKCLWLPWIGTRGLKTLRAFCSLADLKARPAGNPVIGLEFSLPAPDVLARLSVFLKQPPTALQLAEQIQPKQSRKYDRYLTEDLLNLSVSREVVDLEPALQALRIACGVTP